MHESSQESQMNVIHLFNIALYDIVLYFYHGSLLPGAGFIVFKFLYSNKKQKPPKNLKQRMEKL